MKEDKYLTTGTKSIKQFEEDRREWQIWSKLNKIQINSICWILLCTFLFNIKSFIWMNQYLHFTVEQMNLATNLMIYIDTIIENTSTSQRFPWISNETYFSTNFCPFSDRTCVSRTGKKACHYSIFSLNYHLENHIDILIRAYKIPSVS